MYDNLQFKEVACAPFCLYRTCGPQRHLRACMHADANGYILQSSYSYHLFTKHLLLHIDIEDLYGHPNCVHVTGMLIHLQR